MPRGDRTGPMGMGPKTGRGAGYCNGFASPGFAGSAGFGPGYGRGRGFGRMFCANGAPGWGRGGYPAYGTGGAAPQDEKAFLSGQAEFLEDRLQQVKKRLSDLEEEAE